MPISIANYGPGRFHLLLLLVILTASINSYAYVHRGPRPGYAQDPYRPEFFRPGVRLDYQSDAVEITDHGKAARVHCWRVSKMHWDDSIGAFDYDSLYGEPEQETEIPARTVVETESLRLEGSSIVGPWIFGSREWVPVTRLTARLAWKPRSIFRGTFIALADSIVFSLRALVDSVHDSRWCWGEGSLGGEIHVDAYVGYSPKGSTVDALDDFLSRKGGFRLTFTGGEGIPIAKCYISYRRLIWLRTTQTREIRSHTDHEWINYYWRDRYSLDIPGSAEIFAWEINGVLNTLDAIWNRSTP